MLTAHYTAHKRRFTNIFWCVYASWLVHRCVGLSVVLSAHNQLQYNLALRSLKGPITFICYCQNLLKPIYRITENLVWGSKVKSVEVRFPVLLGPLERSFTVFFNQWISPKITVSKRPPPPPPLPPLPPPALPGRMVVPTGTCYLSIYLSIYMINSLLTRVDSEPHLVLFLIPTMSLPAFLWHSA